MNVKYLVWIGLPIGILFIVTVAYVSHVKGWDQQKVTINDEMLMTQCVEIAESITPEGADASIVASVLFRESKKRWSF